MIVDNDYLYVNILEIINKVEYKNHVFSFFFSSGNKEFAEKYYGTDFKSIDLKNETDSFFNNFDVFFSLHCKQIFPAVLYEKHRCINVHPGYNPYNRGWYPQVFSIINKKPVGVTIHEIGTEIDNGPIIIQQKVDINVSDTSYDVYKQIQQIEISLLKKHLIDLIEGRYTTFISKNKGNLNTKADFNEFCKLDLSQNVTLGQAIDILRAGTFEDYNNLWFLDYKNNKIYVKIKLTREDSSDL